MIRAYRLYRNATEHAAQPASTHQVCIELLQVPNLWTWFLLQLEESTSGVCGMLQEVPLPKWLANLHGRWGCECKPDEKCECYGRFGDYFGNDWGGLWHCYIECPISDRVFQNTREGLRHINVPLDGQWDDWPEVQWIRDDIKREAAGQEWHWTLYPGDGWLFKFLEWATRPWRKDARTENKP